jgi:hypothetical protein
MDINQDSYIGYGTTTPQTIIHLVQSNVTLRLEDPRNDIGGSVNIEFKNGSGQFGATQNSDWKLSSSNSFFHITSASDNNTCNILSINNEGNIIVRNDIVIGGNFVKDGEVIDISKIGSIDEASYSYVSNYVNISSNNVIDNIYFNFYTKDQINSCNYIKSELLPTNIVTQHILNSCNYVKDISFIKNYWKNIEATSKNSIYYGAPVKIGGNNSIDIADNYILDIIGNVRVNGVITQGWSGDGSTSGDGGGLNANIFGSGSEITNLNANNIASGVLQVQYGGTGTSAIEQNRVLIGGANSITSSSQLTWDNTTNTLSVFDIRGIGSNISRIHSSNISDGIIDSKRLPIATNDKIGAIKKGDNIDIDNNGRLSVNLGYYTGDATINGDLIVNSNLIVNGQSMQLNTTEYSTEKLAIINTGSGPSLSVKQSTQTNNIVNISNYENTEVFNITPEGYINFTEQINGINKTQFSKIANIDSNDSNCSNFILYTSNNLFDDYVVRDHFTSNFIRSTSNHLFDDYVSRDHFTSNFVRSTSNLLFEDYVVRDSSLATAITTSAGYTSNYVNINKYTDDKVKTVLSNSAGNNMVWNNVSKRFDVPFDGNYNSLTNKLTAGNNIHIDNNDNNKVSLHLDLYNGNTTINGDLTVNNDLIVLGTQTTISTADYSTEKLTITNTGIGPTLTIKQTSLTNNIVNISNYLDKEVFNITVDGNVNFSENMNGINKTQFSKIANIDSNDLYVSNFVRGSSDILFADYTTRFEVATSELTTYADNIGTYTSNYVAESGNLLFIDYSARFDYLSATAESINTNASNYVDITSNLLFADYTEKLSEISFKVTENSNSSNFTRATSNLLFDDYVIRDDFTSNFVRASSNLLFADYVARIGTSSSEWATSGENIYNNNTNNVGIGTDNPTAYKLQVVGSIGASGDISASYSDERLKEVSEYIKDVLPILSKINVFRYHCNDIGEKYGYDKSKHELGLSAQEIQKYYPELVSLAPFDSAYDSETKQVVSKSGEDYLTLKYERLVPVLLQGIKELKQEINELKVRLSKLE